MPRDGLEPARLRGLVALQQAVGDRLDRRENIALLRLGGQLSGDNAINLEIVIPSARVELGLEVENDIRIGDGLKLRRLVLGLERLEDFFGAVHEVENVGRVLARIGAVEARSVCTA